MPSGTLFQDAPCHAALSALPGWNGTACPPDAAAVARDASCHALGSTAPRSQPAGKGDQNGSIKSRVGHHGLHEATALEIIAS